jgi:tetratricopeptide (TPR) repeat protein
MTGALWPSSFVAAMFAFHPLNVESVAWIAERKNVLSTLFWLITMLAYVHYAEKPTAKNYGLVVLFFTLGLMSKPMLVTLPFVLLLLDYWPLRRLKLWKERESNEILEKNTIQRSEIFKLVFEKIPLFALTIGLSIVTAYLQNVAGALRSLNLFPLQVRLTNAMVSYLEYLVKMIWPSNLSVFYPHPESALPIWKGILCGMVLVGITILAVKWIRKTPYFAVGWFWYLGTLVPVIGIVQVGGQSMADRFAYIPLIGIFIIVAWGVPALIPKWRYKEKVLSISAGVVILALLITTWKQVSHWKNSITLFKHAVSVTENQYPSLAVAYANLGVALVKQGDIDTAISHYKTAIKINPNFANAYNNLGFVLAQQGSLKKAISHYKTAIKINPNFDKAYNNLGFVLAQQGSLKKAISHYKTAIKINPNFDKAYSNLGIALAKQGDIDTAISHYKTAIKINPNFAKAYSNLGIALVKKGDIGTAISHYKTAIKINPNFDKAYSNLGIALVKQGDIGTAISHYKTAIKINPNSAENYNNLGTGLAQQGSLKEAINHFQEALRLKPDFISARKNLEMAIHKYGKAGEYK